MKNLSILILKHFFLSLASVEEAKQVISRTISHSISLFLIIIDLEVVSRELLSPADLTRAQGLCIYELIEVFMVSKDEDLVFVVFQVLALSLQNFNGSQKLLIIGFVVCLNKDHFSREKGYWILLANFKRWV